MPRGGSSAEPQQSIPEQFNEVFAGLEARLSNQLRLERDLIVGAIGGQYTHMNRQQLSREKSHIPIVFLPDEPEGTVCENCGRTFELIRMAIHARACARLKHPYTGKLQAMAAAQQRADALRLQAWAQLTDVPHAASSNLEQLPPIAAAEAPRPRLLRHRWTSALTEDRQPGRVASPSPQAGAQADAQGGAQKDAQGDAQADAQEDAQADARSSAPRLPTSNPGQTPALPTAGAEATAERPHQQRAASMQSQTASPPPLPLQQQPPHPSQRRTPMTQLPPAYYQEDLACTTCDDEVVMAWNNGVSGGELESTTPSGAYFYAQLVDETEEAFDEPKLGQCQVCGRKFALDRLERHESTCMKNASKKPRKMYSASAERLKLQQKAAAEAERERLEKSKRKSTWQNQHEAFQNALKTAAAIAKGEPPPADLHEIEDTRIPCPHCGRKFAADVGERHIPKCPQAKKTPKATTRTPKQRTQTPSGKSLHLDKPMPALPETDELVSHSLSKPKSPAPAKQPPARPPKTRGGSVAAKRGVTLGHPTRPSSDT